MPQDSPICKVVYWRSATLVSRIDGHLLVRLKLFVAHFTLITLLCCNYIGAKAKAKSLGMDI